MRPKRATTGNTTRFSLDIQYQLDYTFLFDSVGNLRGYVGLKPSFYEEGWGYSSQMELVKQLAQKKNAIVKVWFDRVVNTYPIDTAQFLKNQADPFANPVGQSSFQSLNDVFDLALGGFDPTTARPLIDPIIRIRAIQDFTPAQAVGFMFDLKTIIRDTVPVDNKESHNLHALHELDQRIDQLSLLAFDIYMQCREKIFELKANDARARTYAALSRAGLIKESDAS
jgi:hypothetical protein